MQSCKIAPEKDVDGHQDDSIDVADASPEWLLLNAGQRLLQHNLLSWPRESAEPVPQPFPPGSV